MNENKSQNVNKNQDKVQVKAEQSKTNYETLKKSQEKLVKARQIKDK